MLESIGEAVYESFIMFPFLFIAYVLMEYIEHKGESKITIYMKKAKSIGPILGALFGVIPQCGFSIIASGLYLNGNITLGTLLSVFISTSDEAIPILIAYPSRYQSLIVIVLMKIVLGIIVGYVIDFLIQKYHFKQYRLKQYLHKDCHEEVQHHSLFYVALRHTIKIFLFILVVNIVFTILVDLIGTDTLAMMLGRGSLWQVFIAALFGFIPHCAASVILTQLYVTGIVTFASLCAGLITSSGLGLLVLLRMNKYKKDVLRIVIILYGVSVLTGVILSFMF